MTTTNTRQATAHGAWREIINAAATPEHHACILSAERYAIPREDWVALEAHYRRLRNEATYADLNGLILTAEQIADLALVVVAGPAGVMGDRLAKPTREHLAEHRLTAVQPGSRCSARHELALLHATLRGVAMLRSVQGKPVQLSANEAAPLSKIELDMRTDLGGTVAWPGTEMTLRVAQLWRLVERVPGPAGVQVHRLTAAGAEALRTLRARLGHQPGLGDRAAVVLEFVAGLAGGDPGSEVPQPDMLTHCVESGWVRQGALVPETTRRRLILNQSGREALDDYRFRRAAKAGARISVPLHSVLVGQWIRMANRRERPGVTAEWVQVDRVEQVPDQRPVEYRLWVKHEAGAPFLYAGRPLRANVRCELRDL